MRLSASKRITFWIAVIVAVVGVVFYLVPVAVLQSLSFWVLLAGFALLALATLIDGL